MPSAFGHACMAFSIGKSYPKTVATLKFLLLGIACAVLPDADVITFHFGIPYDSFFGHRGFFHSFFFALVFAVIVTSVFYRGTSLFSRQGSMYVLFFFLCTASHGLLDMLTSGGRGVAIFAPFDNARYFFPWRPIKVSPIGVGRFFGEWGLRVLKSEAVYIGLPCTLWILAVAAFRRVKGKSA